jgi:rhamnose transport system ATP-binding protein
VLAVDGARGLLDNPAAARDAGIAIIYQEPLLFPDLTVEENIFIGRQPLRTGRRIDRREMRTHVKAVFDRLGVRLDPGRIARGLSIAEQQIVEIGKALSLDAKVIVMDEPTAALSAVEVARLFGVVESLHAAGAAVLFISHRLEEVFELCQRVTVLRDGRWVMSHPIAGLSSDDLVRAMVGRELVEREPEEQTIGDTVLRVERLTREGVFTDVSFEVKAGEIVALAGLVGAGRSEVACAIFGIDRYDAGAVAMNGRRLRRASPTAAMSAGIGPRAGGPAPAGARHGHGDLPEHRARVDARAAPARDDQQRRRATVRQGLGVAAPSSGTGSSPTRRTRSPGATSRRPCSPSGSRGARRC